MTHITMPSLHSDRDVLLAELAQLGVHPDDLDSHPVLCRCWLLGRKDQDHLMTTLQQEQPA